MKRRSLLVQGGWVALFVLGLTVTVFAGELQQKLTAEGAMEQALKRGVLRVGMSTFVPWAMKDKTGHLVGFEIDVATRLAKDLGLKVEFVPTQWAGIIPALLTAKFDTIIGGMSVTAERSLKVNFSIPYDYTGMSIVANKFPGVRAALCHTADSARKSRMHNDANVLVLGQDVDQNTAKQMLKVWFETPFEGGRHQIRLDQIQAIEAENFKNIP
jgi:hypothetical protein